MNKWLVVHQWKESIRSSIWQRKVAANIFVGILALLMIVNLLGLGLFIDVLLKDIAPNADPIVLFNSFLLYYFGIDLLMRFVMQKTPGLSIRPYLHLPVKRSGIIHFLLSKSVGSLFNFLPLLIAVPFAIKVIALQSSASALVWLLAILAILLCNSYLTIYLKRQMIVNPKVDLAFGMILIALIVLDYFGVIPASQLSSILFGGVLENHALLLVPIVVLVLLYGLNYQFLKRHTYLDELAHSKVRKTIAAGDLFYLERFGEVGRLISLEIKLILRNKRLKSNLYFSPLILLLGFLFYGLEDYRNYDIMLIYMGVLFTGMFMIGYGQFIFSWESRYFDAVISSEIDPHLYFKAKFIIMVAACFSHYLFLIPFSYFGIQILYLNTALFLFNIGVNSFILLFKATFNRQRIDLNVSAFSMQGKDAKQFLVVLLLVIIPILIYVPFMRAGIPQMGFVAIGAVGVLGLLFYRPLLKLIVTQFYKQKYKIAAGLRLG
jgi:hypothetical protein